MNVEIMSDPRVQMAYRLTKYAESCTADTRDIIHNLVDHRVNQMTSEPISISANETTARLTKSFASTDAVENWMYNAWNYGF